MANERARDPLQSEAAAWFARMRGPEAEASRADFEAWLARGALHRAAYNRAAEIFAMGKLLAEEPAAPAPPRHTGRFVVLASALMALLVGGWLVFTHIHADGSGANAIARADLPREANGVLVTGAGETRAILLADGSTLRLSPDTRIAVQFDGSARRLALESGDARFEVAHETRPFEVAAGGGTVTARGTLFDVGLAGARVTVRLLRGAIDVALPSADPGRPAPVRRLRAGEALSFAVREPVTAARGNMAAPPSSPAPIRDYEGVTVATLIAEANRTGGPSLRLADPAIGARRLSGRLRIEDTRELAQRLAILFDLIVDSGQANEIVLRRR